MDTQPTPENKPEEVAPATASLKTETTPTQTAPQTENKKPKPAIPQFDAKAITPSEKTLSMIGFIGVFCLFPLLLKKQSAYCQYHGKVSLVLTLCFILFGLFATFLSWFGFQGVEVLVGILNVVIVILAILKVHSGKTVKIPMVSEIALKIKFDS